MQVFNPQIFFFSFASTDTDLSLHSVKNWEPSNTNFLADWNSRRDNCIIWSHVPFNVIFWSTLGAGDVQFTVGTRLERHFTDLWFHPIWRYQSEVCHFSHQKEVLSWQSSRGSLWPHCKFNLPSELAKPFFSFTFMWTLDISCEKLPILWHHFEIESFCLSATMKYEPRILSQILFFRLKPFENVSTAKYDCIVFPNRYSSHVSKIVAASFTRRLPPVHLWRKLGTF